MEDNLFYDTLIYSIIFIFSVVALIILGWKYNHRRPNGISIIEAAESGIAKVNCRALIVIENLPKCTTAKDLVKCLGLKQMVVTKKVQLSVAADRKGQCAGMAVALIPRYCLLQSDILSKNKSVYKQNVIKVREVRNRKIKIMKHVNWLSSDNFNHVGLRGRFQVYHNILQDITTQHGYYLIDGGCYIQYCNAGDVETIICESAEYGLEKIVMKAKNNSNLLKTEIAYCQNYPGYLYTTVGVYPSTSNEFDIKQNTAVNLVLENEKTSKYVAAIGECGIKADEKNKPSFEHEKSVFSQMVQLADRFHKPLLVQSWQNIDAMLKILDECPKVEACMTIGLFRPKVKDIQKWIDKGHYIGLTGGLWANHEKDSALLNAVKTFPLDKIILCSNSPYVYPWFSDEQKEFIAKIKTSEDFKNVCKDSIDSVDNNDDNYSMEPKWLSVVLELLASRLHKSPTSLAQIVNANAERFYKFDQLFQK